MESIFTYLLVFGIIWLVSFVLRKSNKRTVQPANPNNNNPATNTGRQKSSSDLERILSELLGENYLAPQPANIPDTPRQEIQIKQTPLQKNNLNYEENFEEGGSLIEKKDEVTLATSKDNTKISNPYISGFDLTKAVVYSEILQPKYF